jgi:hypothetical protein
MVLHMIECLYSQVSPADVPVPHFPLPCSQELATNLPPKVLRQLATLKPQLYVVDARKVAEDVGLGKRINMVMQTVFFNLSGVVPMEKVSWGEGGRLVQQGCRKGYCSCASATLTQRTT